jgi:hypothetical protein
VVQSEVDKERDAIPAAIGDQRKETIREGAVCELERTEKEAQTLR